MGEHPCKASNSNGALTALDACPKTCGTCTPDAAPEPEEEAAPADEPTDATVATRAEPEAPADEGTADEGTVEAAPTPLNPQCGAWAASGECASNPEYMLAECSTACELKKLEDQYGTGAPAAQPDNAQADEPATATDNDEPDDEPGAGGDDYDTFWAGVKDDDDDDDYGAQGGGDDYGAQGDDDDDETGDGGAQDDGGAYGYGAQDDDDHETGDAWPSQKPGWSDDDDDDDATGSAARERDPAEPAEPAAPETPETPDLGDASATVAQAVAVDVTEPINYEAKWFPMEVVLALFIFTTCAFSISKCRAKDEQYAPVTRHLSQDDLVSLVPEDIESAAPEDVESFVAPSAADKKRMKD